MVDYVQNLIIPVVEVMVILAVVGVLGFIFIRAFRKTWRKQTKWILKYKVLRKKHPENLIAWILNNIEHGIGWYDTKKMLYVQGIKEDKINYIMFLYDQIINEMAKENPKIKEFKKNYSKIKEIDLPNLKNELS